jgi:hypothetical protein
MVNFYYIFLWRGQNIDLFILHFVSKRKESAVFLRHCEERAKFRDLKTDYLMRWFVSFLDWNNQTLKSHLLRWFYIQTNIILIVNAVGQVVT